MQEFGASLQSDLSDSLEESEMNRLLHASLRFLLERLEVIVAEDRPSSGKTLRFRVLR